MKELYVPEMKVLHGEILPPLKPENSEAKDKTLQVYFIQINNTTVHESPIIFFAEEYQGSDDPAERMGELAGEAIVFSAFVFVSAITAIAQDWQRRRSSSPSS
jgi:hypothetical protein